MIVLVCFLHKQPRIYVSVPHHNGKTITYDAIGNPLYDGKWSYTWAQGRQLAQMSYGSNVWTFTYDADGMRTGRSNLGTSSYTYTYNGSQLVRMNSSSGNMRFTYGADGSPLTITYNGTTYYYVTNMQGDVVAMVDSSGAMVVEYTYDAWGRLLSTTGDDTLVLTLGLHNPLRYRGYVYDRETGLYYLESRYYNPTTGRFINADNYPSTGQGLLGNNMFAYCNNNPVMREDRNGQFWGVVAKIGLGLLSQYVGDVLGNIADGKSGWDIFTPTSSVGEYIAAGVTALIPGSDFGSAIIRSTVTESIKGVERYVLGEDVNLGQAFCNVIVGSAVDVGISKLSDFVSSKITATGPKNYSSFAGKQRKKNPSIKQEDIYKKMRRASTFNYIANEAADFSFSVLSTIVSP